MTFCQPCDRYFRYEWSLTQHLEAKHSHTYCFRCERHFAHEPAKRQHVANSSQHHVCTYCHSEPDYESESDLNEHLERSHHVCTTCDETFYDEDDLMQHDVDYHNRCSICSRLFNSRSNLINHRKVHARKNIECLGCTRMFISHSAMMLHLEADTCASSANRRVIRNLVTDYYDQHEDWQSCSEDGFDFEKGLDCDNCGTRFQLMSALLQHAESETCNGRVSDYSELLCYIERELFRL